MDNTEPVETHLIDQSTILICDDDPLIGMFTGKLLQHLGYAVVLTESGEAALGRFAANSGIQAVVLDYRLPDLPAQAVIDGLEAINPSVRILVCSGFQSASLGLTRKTGVLAYLDKPYGIEKMGDALSKLLKNPVAML